MVWKEKGASVSPSRQLDRPVGSKVIPPTIITWRGKAGTREGRGKLFGPVFRGGGGELLAHGQLLAQCVCSFPIIRKRTDLLCPSESFVFLSESWRARWSRKEGGERNVGQWVDAAESEN